MFITCISKSIARDETCISKSVEEKRRCVSDEEKTAEQRIPKRENEKIQGLL